MQVADLCAPPLSAPSISRQQKACQVSGHGGLVGQTRGRRDDLVGGGGGGEAGGSGEEEG